MSKEGVAEGGPGLGNLHINHCHYITGSALVADIQGAGLHREHGMHLQGQERECLKRLLEQTTKKA